VQRVFPDAPPDIIIAAHGYPYNLHGFKYSGIADVHVPKAIILSDYWDLAENHFEGFVTFVQESEINFILSYFLQPLEIWGATPIADRFIYLPPSFDPQMFNDWQMDKSYDVGFLAAGTTEYSPFYPERFKIHQKLLKNTRIKYLAAKHPGWGRHKDKTPLVGRNFSKAINSCKIFITTGGKYRNAQQKIFEALASRTLLMMDEAIGLDRLSLEENVHFVKISEDDVLDKIDYYLSHSALCDSIAEAGYRLALRRHSCYVRAIEFYEQVSMRSPVS
jgi:spore maturation protein CgeB